MIECIKAKITICFKNNFGLSLSVNNPGFRKNCRCYPKRGKRPDCTMLYYGWYL